MAGDWPQRSEVDQAWREVIASARSRESVHDWTVPWIEGDRAHERASDLMVSDGLLYLHGRDMLTTDSAGLRTYVLSDAEVVQRYEAWLTRCIAYDQDPEGWSHRQVEIARKVAAAERGLTSAWREASNELGIRVVAPFVLAGMIFPVHLPDFGGPHGMVIAVQRSEAVAWVSSTSLAPLIVTDFGPSGRCRAGGTFDTLMGERFAWTLCSGR